MQRIDQINPERLRWGIEDRQLQVDDLASKASVSKRMLEKVLQEEAGAGLTFKQLKSVADCLGRGVLFFLEAGPVQEDLVHSLQFRTLANQKPELPGEVRGLIERVDRLRDVYLDLFDEEDDRPRFDPPAVQGEQPHKAAKMAREWLELDPKESYDFVKYREAVEAKGVLVFLSTGYPGRWRFPPDSPIAGFSMYFDDCPVIAVRKQTNANRQTFTLMHELAHLILHQMSMIDDEDDLYAYQGREKDANAFAGHLLIPDEELAKVNDGRRPATPAEYKPWLEPSTARLGVSTEAFLRRLMDVGRLDKTDYEAYRKYLAAVPLPPKDRDGGTRWRDREPIHLFGNHYVRTVLGAVQSKQISLNKASSYLDNLKIPDVHKLEKHIASL